MHSSVVLLVLSFIAAALAQDCPPCATMKWALCDDVGCPCTLLVGENVKQSVNCSVLVPKCFLMKAETYRAKKGLSTRSISGKPTEHAFVDNDGIYDPECENTGIFKAKQCNNTDTCWCVNSAGVRRTDKGDKNLKCAKLVDTYWIRAELKHKDVQANLDANILKSAIADAIQKRYNLDKKFVKDVQNLTPHFVLDINKKYDKDSKTIVVDMQKEKNGKEDLATVAYYMEKDIKILPLFTSESKFTPSVGNQGLDFSNILIYYVDSEPPTFTMKRLTGGVIAVIVVVILAVIAGLVVLYLARRRERANYQKTQVRELDEMQKSLS